MKPERADKAEARLAPREKPAERREGDSGLWFPRGLRGAEMEGRKREEGKARLKKAARAEEEQPARAF